MAALHCFFHTPFIGRKVNLTCLHACYSMLANPKCNDAGIFLALPDSNRRFSFSHSYKLLNNVSELMEQEFGVFSLSCCLSLPEILLVKSPIGSLQYKELNDHERRLCEHSAQKGS